MHPSDPTERLTITDIAIREGLGDQVARERALKALQRCYLDADDETMLAVVMRGAQLREA